MSNLQVRENKVTKMENAAEIQKNRVQQEVEGQIIMAKRFPRDLNEAYTKIIASCKRKGLAEKATYMYPRGKEKVSGPSIRLAEVMAQNWGNIDFGVVELGRNSQESQLMAYCWDLESNTRQVKIFTMPHTRFSKTTGNQKLIDPRDIYENNANYGARRLRACILGVIPQDIAEDAVSECRRTLSSSQSEKPINDRIRKMVSSFDEISVKRDDLELRLGHPVDKCTGEEIIELIEIYNSIRDGFSKKTDWFTGHGDQKQKPEQITPENEGYLFEMEVPNG